MPSVQFNLEKPFPDPGLFLYPLEIFIEEPCTFWGERPINCPRPTTRLRWGTDGTVSQALEKGNYWYSHYFFSSRNMIYNTKGLFNVGDETQAVRVDNYRAVLGGSVYTLFDSAPGCGICVCTIFCRQSLLPETDPHPEYANNCLDIIVDDCGIWDFLTERYIQAHRPRAGEFKSTRVVSYLMKPGRHTIRAEQLFGHHFDHRMWRDRTFEMNEFQAAVIEVFGWEYLLDLYAGELPNSGSQGRQGLEIAVVNVG